LKVVANASVIGLSSIGRLTLLHERFPGGVLNPPAVWREVGEQGGERPGAREVARAKGITVRDVTAREIVQLLEMELEEGEAEAIALAHEIGAVVVLLDERDARRGSKSMTIRYTRHARYKFSLLEQHGFPVTEQQVANTLMRPDMVPQPGNRHIA